MTLPGQRNGVIARGKGGEQGICKGNRETRRTNRRALNPKTKKRNARALIKEGNGGYERDLSPAMIRFVASISRSRCVARLIRMKPC